MKVVNMNNVVTNLLTYTQAYILIMHIPRRLPKTEFSVKEKGSW